MIMDTESTLEPIRLPDSKPSGDPEALWALQLRLLAIAETTLGPRDVSKTIYQPQFSDNGPCIRNTPNLDAAFAELSRAGEEYWPTVVFEMAHETVHLLNPFPGGANNLEEGVAVAFSLYVQPGFGVSIRPSFPSYVQAFRLVSLLPGGPLQSAQRIRNRCGALNDITLLDLQGLFPSVGEAVLQDLTERFNRNVG